MAGRIRFSGRGELLRGLAIGLAFGFLVDKGGGTDYGIIMGQLLLRDFRILKLLLTAAVVGAIGLHALRAMGQVEFRVKPCRLKMIIAGGLVFGLGFGLLGYCPGTAAGAFGTGSIHALAGMIGIVLGAGAFAWLYPGLAGFSQRDDMGPVTIPEMAGVSPWVFIVVLTSLSFWLFYYLEMYAL